MKPLYLIAYPVRILPIIITILTASLLTACDGGSLYPVPENTTPVNNTYLNYAPEIQSSPSASIDENTTLVMNVSAWDANGDSIIYSLSGTNDDALFTIDPSTGALKFITAPDAESPTDSNADNIYNVKVTASDGQQFSTQSITITVNNVSEFAPTFTTPASFTMLENTTTVTTVAANDIEGDSISYSLSGTVDDALFSIIPSSGTLSFKIAPDYESPKDSGADNTYNIQVRASDGINAVTQDLTVTVADINDAPRFTSASSITLDENSLAVMSVLATDDDGDSISYSLTGTVDDSLFAIDATTGALSFISGPDYENPTDIGANNTYDIQVSASDALLTTDLPLSITVNNTNESPPLFTSPTAASQMENTTSVTTVSASDADGDTITYSLSGSVDDALFSIDPSSGALTFIAPPDFETPSDNGGDNNYDIQVSASDGTYNTSQAVTITVTDELELAVASGGSKTLSFTWSTYGGAAYYKLLVNPDGVSGYSQNGGDIVSTSTDVIIPVHLSDWINASYMLEAYDGSNTLLASSAATSATNLMLSSIGYIKASDVGSIDYFGLSVALSGDGATLAVGTPLDDSATSGINTMPNDNGTANDSGAVYLFRFDGSSWSQQAYIKASNIGTAYQFGMSVSLNSDGNTLAVGANGEGSATSGINTVANDDGTANASGAAYVYHYDGSNWAEQAYIKPSNTGALDQFGYVVNISADGKTLAVGSPAEDSETSGVYSTPNDTGFADDSGAAYVFSYDGTNWSQQAYVKSSYPSPGDKFGIKLALSGDGSTMAIGATGEDSATTGINSTPFSTGSLPGSGAVYLFRFASGLWSEEAYIKPSNTGAGDAFGYAVSLSQDGNTMAVSAAYEDSATTGINTIPSDDGTANDSGALYLFRFNSGWAEQAYIKSSNNGSGDLFGTSLSLSSDGNILAVSAGLDDSASTGVNFSALDNGAADDSGAAYIFRYDGANWNEGPYIKAPNTGAVDYFGYSLDLSDDGGTLAVSAPQEDSVTTGINSTPNDSGSANDSGAVYLY